MAKASRDRKSVPSPAESTVSGAGGFSSVVLNRIFFAVALFGILLTLHLWIQTERGFDRGCLGLSNPAPTAELGCEAVAQSDASRLLGVSNVVWGFLFYVFMAGLAFVRTFVSEARARWLKRGLFVFSGFAFLYSVYLVLYQVFAIEDVCVLCLTSAGTVTTLLIIATLDSLSKGPAGVDPKAMTTEIGSFALTSFVGFALAFALIVIVNGVGARGDSRDEIGAIVSNTLPQLIDPQFLRQMAPCSYADDPPALTNVNAFIFPEDQFIGSADAPIRVIKFFDPNCPHCKTLHEVLKDVFPNNTEKARFYYRPFPIWAFSTPQVQALYLAREQGKFYEMMEGQFDRQKQGGLSQAELVEIARDIDLDVDRFREGLGNGAYLNQINQERQAILDAGVNSFPKLAIEGHFLPNNRQSMNATCIAGMIDQEYNARFRPSQVSE